MDYLADNAGLGLTSEQTDKIIQFQDLTGIDDISICRDVLQRHQWDLEVAVQEQLNIREGRPSLYATESRPPEVINDHSVQHIFYSLPSDGSGSGVMGLFRSIFQFFINMFYNTLLAIFQTGYRLMRPDSRRFITDPLADVMSFITFFEEKYGSSHPVFYQGTYSQALNDAKQELRFLLVYLHNEDSPDAQTFCRTSLTATSVVSFINTKMLFWACSVKSQEGYRVSQALREGYYPFLAVIVLKDNRMTIVGRLEGLNDPQTLLQRLTTIINDNEICLMQARADRMERSLTQTLRAQQDEAFMESLRADQEKERLKELERQLLLEEQRRREAEVLAEEQRRRDIAAEKISSADKVPEEPPVNHPDVVHVVFKLPSGQRLDRRFRKDDTLEDIFYYVFCHPESPDCFEITTNFPKRVLNCRPQYPGDSVETLEQAQLKNREVLFVNDLDA